MGFLTTAPAPTMRRLMNVWPPFLFSGIRVVALDEDFRHARVRLVKRRWNGNVFGTHFGGSLFAMTDPFWLLLVLRNLGPGYVVWDRSAEVEFVSPGRRDVYVDFRLTDEELAELRAQADAGDRVLRWFHCEVVTSDGTLVARVRKQVYVRRRAEGPRAALPRPRDGHSGGPSVRAEAVDKGGR